MTLSGGCVSSTLDNLPDPFAGVCVWKIERVSCTSFV